MRRFAACLNRYLLRKHRFKKRDNNDLIIDSCASSSSPPRKIIYFKPIPRFRLKEFDKPKFREEAYKEKNVVRKGENGVG